MNGWDIGAFEALPTLALVGVPGNKTVCLSWQVHTTLPASATFRIDYSPTDGTQPSPVTGISNTARAFTLNGLSNYTLYTVTLTAVDNGNSLFNDLVQVMPSDRLVSLPLLIKGY
jgi:hypothetical protein